MAHKGQVDKIGRPYEEHLRAVATYARILMGDHDDLTTALAWLHDIVEDGYVSLEELRQWGAPKRLVDGIALLSRPSSLSYDQYIDDIVAEGGRSEYIVKMADLLDHFDHTEDLYKINPARAISLNKRYVRAWQKLAGDFALFTPVSFVSGPEFLDYLKNLPDST